MFTQCTSLVDCNCVAVMLIENSSLKEEVHKEICSRGNFALQLVLCCDQLCYFILLTDKFFLLSVQ